MVETIVTFIFAHSGIVTIVAGWAASEILAFVPVKANSILQLAAQFVVAIGNKILKKGDEATAAVKAENTVTSNEIAS